MQVSYESQQDKNQYIKHLLENYHTIKSWTEQMKLRLTMLKDETLDETIESLVYPDSTIKDRVQCAPRNDTVALVASIYRHVNWQVRHAPRSEIVKIIEANDYMIKQLELAVDSLEMKYMIPIKGIYFDRKTAWEIADEMGWCDRTVWRNRDRAIDMLVSTIT